MTTILKIGTFSCSHDQDIMHQGYINYLGSVDYIINRVVFPCPVSTSLTTRSQDWPINIADKIHKLLKADGPSELFVLEYDMVFL